MKALGGFREIADGYDGFVCDLWGVVHDGVSPLPGAPECLRALRAAGKRIVMLTNAPRRAGKVIAQLRGMGIEDELYAGVMSSGEAVHLMLRDRPDPWWTAAGSRMFYLGPDRDLAVVEGLPIERVLDPAAASFVLNTGPDHLEDPAALPTYEDVLRRCVAAGLPMVCANPDLEVIRGGVRVLCAGALAQRYGELGGDVRSLGKPDPAIYQPALAMLGVDPARVLAVGDALRTDIAGARAAGLDSCWVLGGIHGEHLAEGEAEMAARAAGLAPVASIESFVW